MQQVIWLLLLIDLMNDNNLVIFNYYRIFKIWPRIASFEKRALENYWGLRKSEGRRLVSGDRRNVSLWTIWVSILCCTSHSTFYTRAPEQLGKFYLFANVSCFWQPTSIAAADTVQKPIVLRYTIVISVQSQQSLGLERNLRGKYRLLSVQLVVWFHYWSGLYLKWTECAYLCVPVVIETSRPGDRNNTIYIKYLPHYASASGSELVSALRIRRVKPRKSANIEELLPPVNFRKLWINKYLQWVIVGTF